MLGKGAVQVGDFDAMHRVGIGKGSLFCPFRGSYKRLASSYFECMRSEYRRGFGFYTKATLSER